MTMVAADLVLWDGDCGFCRRGIAWVERQDREGRFRCVPYQQAEHPLLDAALRDACAKAVHVITADDQVLAGGRAALYVLEGIGWRGRARVLGSPPLFWAVEAGYGLVARHRRLFSRFLFR